VEGETEHLDQVLTQLAEQLKELEEALSGERQEFTRAKLQRAAQERGAAFIRRLQRTRQHAMSKFAELTKQAFSFLQSDFGPGRTPHFTFRMGWSRRVYGLIPIHCV
jgi:hypothetical protein